jgi:hypothetical protein
MITDMVGGKVDRKRREAREPAFLKPPLPQRSMAELLIRLSK